MEPHDTQGSSEQQEPPADVPAVEYLKAARTHLRNDRRKEAYSILLKAAPVHPNHPIILSYLGWLQAVVDKRYQSGLASCRKSFALFKTSDPRSAARIYPVLYLNLGMTYLAADRKKEAVENFRKGLQYDRNHGELKREMKRLGIRKEPPLSFLSRSNVLNRVIGKLVHERSQHSQATR